MAEFDMVTRVGEKHVSGGSATFPSQGGVPQRPPNFWDLLRVRTQYEKPRTGSGVVRMDPLRFLAGCRISRLNQG